ncbi:TonB-dependent siderophore receptor [Acinetobacter soli]|uniref:TonB-dependent receptor n=1 Tax=Acinetobacter soli TaxID=487316 RepID=UPI00280D0789|nr:TonB-dependent siderophore receptor [Acinetobacter soli]MDQ8994842.1 TonB-dependent siderophore receptor [Acinetobacter soli]
MNTSIHFRKATLSISITFLLSHNVIAGENTQSAQQLPTITVKAEATDNTTLSNGQVTKKSQVGILGNKDALDTPFSITSYTAKYIEDHQAKTVAEVLQSDPSVRNAFSANGLGEYFNIRGLYTQSHELAWDGAFGLVPHNRVPTEFLERVEVFRGTSGLLFGMSLGGAVGGVINVVPKRATDEPITRFTTTYSSDSNIGEHVDIGRRFGENNQFGVRVNALKSHGDTALDSQTEDRRLGSIALDFKGTDLRASLDIYNIKEKLSGAMPLLTSFASSTIPKAPDATINTMPGAYGYTKTTAAIGQVEYDLSDDWTAYLKGGTKQQKAGGYMANNALGRNAQANGDYIAVSRNTANKTDVNSVETGIRGHLKTGEIDHDVVLSANVIDQDVYMGLATGGSWASNIYSPAAVGILAAEPSVLKTSDITLSSVALADTLSYADDKYQLILGLRHQQVKSQSYSITTGNAIAGSDYNKSAVTPALGFVVKPWNNSISLYGNYVEGLSPGETVSVTTAANYGETLAPYKSKQYELGTKWENGTFRNTLSIYQITKPLLIGDTSGTYSMSGEQRNRGIEWTTAGQILSNVRMLGGVVYMDAEQTKTTNGIYDGKDVYGIPHWQSNLGFEWDVNQIEGLTLTANTIYTGTEYVDSANTQKLPSWFRLDAGGRYSTSIANHKVTFRGGVDNIFDKHYWAGVWNGMFVSIGTPRTYKLSMQFDF